MVFSPVPSPFDMLTKVLATRALSFLSTLLLYQVASLSRGKPIVFVGATLLTHHNLIQRFELDKTRLLSFFNTIESGYNNVPYHNSLHGADVGATLSIMLSNGLVKVSEYRA